MFLIFKKDLDTIQTVSHYGALDGLEPARCVQPFDTVAHGVTYKVHVREMHNQVPQRKTEIGKQIS